MCNRDFSIPPIERGTPRELTTLEKQLVESDNSFGLKLFKEIAKTQVDTNIFISPLSIAMALSMTYNGSAGTTEEAMRNTLEFGNMSFQDINESFKSLIQLLTNLDPKVKFQIANSIWYRLGFSVEQDFLDVNKTYFDAEVRDLDFSSPTAPDIINAWVDENTNGKIKEIIDRINPLVVMYLINAIYFKGTWTYEFDKDLTTDDIFTKTDSSQVPCRMMNQEGNFSYLENTDFQAVDLPYGDGKFSMTILLPKPGKSIDEFIAEITTENWIQWTNAFTENAGKLYMPKFKLEYEIKLNKSLSNMGMGIAFDIRQADFSRINPNEDLFISEVKHKTFVEVDEEGTEAAAVTSVEISLTMTDPTGFIMVVNRPFVFIIRENHSNTILFMGKVVEPVL